MASRRKDFTAPVIGTPATGVDLNDLYAPTPAPERPTRSDPAPAETTPERPPRRRVRSGGAGRPRAAVADPPVTTDVGARQAVDPPAAAATAASAPPAASAAPAQPAEAEVLTQIYTYLPADLETRLHRAAYARGGEGQKSVIVREALSAFLETWRRAEASGELEELMAEIRHTEADVDTGAHTPRIYRVATDAKQALYALAGLHRLPMAACLRFAIRRGIEAAEAE